MGRMLFSLGVANPVVVQVAPPTPQVPLVWRMLETFAYDC